MLTYDLADFVLLEELVVEEVEEGAIVMVGVEALSLILNT
jgi:hypothetical protein